MIIACQAQHAAVSRRTRSIAMTEYVAAAVDARPLAVPNPDDAVIARTRGQIDLLRTPDRCRRKVLVHTRLEFDLVPFEMAASGKELLIVTTEGRTAITGNEACCVETSGAVAADLRHRQSDQRLKAGHEYVA